jgi:hypothetical protein
MVAERHLDKLLGTPFGIKVDTQDIDEFLMSKVQRKLAY